jgi:hypothetical protein
MDIEEKKIYLDAGYVDFAYIVSVRIKGSDITISKPSSMMMNHKGTQRYWPNDKFWFEECTCPIDRLYIPNHTNINLVSPLEFTPSIYFYTLPQHLEEAVRWALNQVLTATIAKINDTNILLNGFYQTQDSLKTLMTLDDITGVLTDY